MHERSSMLSANEETRDNSIAVLDLEKCLFAAIPRLRRVIASRDVLNAAGDDIIQETIVEAWRSFAKIHDSTRFDAWLDGICRNVCLRYLRARYHQMRHEVPLLDDVTNGKLALIDPAEELHQADLVVLLDHALGYLSAASRHALKLCYVDNLAATDAALQLGLSRNAFDVRLLRARRQLQAALSGPLRAEARAFGIALEDEDDDGWRESREWCMWCGSRRLRGIFAEHPDFGSVLRMRCPDCSPRYDLDHVNTTGIVTVDHLHSFRPALKRLHQAVIALLPIYQNALRRDSAVPCSCGKTVSMRICTGYDLGHPLPSTFWIALDCPQCGTNIMSLSNLWITHPAIRQFKKKYPRSINESACFVTYSNRPAIQHTIRSLPDHARLTIFADAQSGEILAIAADP